MVTDYLLKRRVQGFSKPAIFNSGLLGGDASRLPRSFEEPPEHRIRLRKLCAPCRHVLGE